MKALVTSHVLVYSLCLGLIGLAISFESLTRSQRRSFPRTESLATARQAQVALLEGLASYQSAVTRERLGDRSPLVTARLELAQRQISKALRMRLPVHQLPQAYFTLGDSYLHGNADPVLAERALRRCLDLAPGHFAALCSLARCYSLMGLAIQEARAWERALSLRPDTASVHRDAALAYSRSTLPDRVERAYDHAIAAVQLDESLEPTLTGILEAGETPRSDDDFQDSADSSLREAGGDAGLRADRQPEPSLSEAEADRYAQEIERVLKN